MRPMSVVMINEDAKHALEMLGIEDQEAVQTFGADRPYETLRHPVRLRRTKRRANHPDPVAAEYLVETGREFLVSIANQVTNRL